MHKGGQINNVQLITGVRVATTKLQCSVQRMEVIVKKKKVGGGGGGGGSG